MISCAAMAAVTARAVIPQAPMAYANNMLVGGYRKLVDLHVVSSTCIDAFGSMALQHT
jgi:hypothetical protein